MEARQNPGSLEKNQTEVEIQFQVNGKTYSVKRIIERGKGTTYSEIRENGKLLDAPSTQRVSESVEKILKINYDLFSKAIYSEAYPTNLIKLLGTKLGRVIHSHLGNLEIASANYRNPEGTKELNLSWEEYVRYGRRDSLEIFIRKNSK